MARGVGHGAVGVAPMDRVEMFGEVVLEFVRDMAGQNVGWCHHGEAWRHGVALRNEEVKHGGADADAE